MANPSVTVDFLSDTSGLSKGINEANSSAKGFGKTLGSVAKGGAIAAGAAGVGALVFTLKTGIGEFQEATKVAAQTEATIKSTGGAANVSAGHVSSLAESLMKKSGVDDEAIASGENLLLTFTNVRNEVGKGNDIFDQATTAALDMSVALGTDMKTSAMQLGKALNDPVAGMTKLTKSGVTFTDAQKEQVKAMVEAGDTMGAQKIILAELNKEFGGSAEAVGKTLPGQISILKESFNNFAGMLVGKLVPYVERAMAALQENWPQIQAALSTAWTIIQPILAALGEAFKAVGQIIVGVVGLIRDNWGTIGPIVQLVADSIKLTFDLIAGILRTIAALLRGDWAQAWEEFKNVISTAVDLIKSRIELALLPLKMVLEALWNGIKTAAETAWNALKTVILGVVDGIKSSLTEKWNAIKTAVETAVNLLKTALETAWNAIKTVVETASGGVKTAVNAVKTAFDAAKSAGSALAGFFEGAWDKATSAAKTAASVVSGGVDAVKGAFDGAKGAVTSLVGYLEGPMKTAFNAAKGVVDAFAGPFNAVKGAIEGVIGAVERLIGALGRIKVPDIHLPNLPGIPGLASGGVVSRPTLALIGEGRGREIVAPESLMRKLLREEGGGSGGGPVNVRVFIGDTELKGIVRSEVTSVNTGIARTLLAGTA